MRDTLRRLWREFWAPHPPRDCTKSKPPSNPPPTPPMPSCLPTKACHRCEGYAFDEQVLRADMEAIRASLGRSEAALADMRRGVEILGECLEADISADDWFLVLDELPAAARSVLEVGQEPAEDTTP